jgi:ABC-2 type transport system permease protein
MNEVIQLMLPGMMYFWVLFIGQGPLQEILNEQTNHTLARILAAPVTVSQFLLSKMIRCFILCLLIQILLLLVSSLLFGIHWGSPLPMALAMAAGSFSMTGLLAFTYSLAKTKEQANVMSTITLVICAMMGGSMFPFEQLPKALQAVGQFTPNRWGILALQGVIKAKPLGELIVPLGCLIVFGLLASVAAYYLFQRQLTQASRA